MPDDGDWRTDEAWDLESDVWKQVLRRNGFPLQRRDLPDDLEPYRDWLEAVIRLTRLAVRKGSVQELNALFWWQVGARDESGREETVGLLHEDKLELSSQVGFLEEENVPEVPRKLQSYLQSTVSITLFESVVRDGFLFLTGLLQCIGNNASNKHYGIWNEAFEEGKDGLRLDQVYNVLKKVRDEIDKVREMIDDIDQDGVVEEGDLDALWGLADDWNPRDDDSDWPVSDNLTGIRDNLAHGKFLAMETGDIQFNPHAHNLVNLHDVARDEPHPYAYKEITYEGANDLKELANCLSAIFFAMYEEFRRPMVRCPDSEDLPEINPDLLEAAKKPLDEVDPQEKVAAKERRREQLRAMQDVVEVEDVRVREDRGEGARDEEED